MTTAGLADGLARPLRRPGHGPIAPTPDLDTDVAYLLATTGHDRQTQYCAEVAVRHASEHSRPVSPQSPGDLD
jgi:hypothetical protein